MQNLRVILNDIYDLKRVFLVRDSERGLSWVGQNLFYFNIIIMGLDISFIIIIDK